MPTVSTVSTITVTVDLRPALAVAAARTALEAAQAEWSGAHLTDVESEDARQKVLDAEATLAAAEAALAATLRSFRDHPEAWGCLPVGAPAPDNAYCFVERGMGGGTLAVQGGL